MKMSVLSILVHIVLIAILESQLLIITIDKATDSD